jgi:hypothetical protein
MVRSYGNVGDVQGSDAAGERTQAVARLSGLWRRSLILRPDGTRDTTTWVRWLQGRKDFIDLRQPVPLRSFPALTGRAHLTPEDCAWLARQEGFAGELVSDGRFFEWQRSIDYQPRSARADAGALDWEGDVLVEHGRDVDYLEHWHREALETAVPTCTLELRGRDTRVSALLLRVGSVFMFARDREAPAPAGRTLVDCVMSASSRGEAQQLIDCEIAFGAVRDGQYRILASTLPWRVGELLAPRWVGDTVELADRSPQGEAVTLAWDIAHGDGQPQDLSAA